MFQSAVPKIPDGEVAVFKPAVAKVLFIIQELGPPLGLFINAEKCELFSLGDLSSFSPLMKKSGVPNVEILGAPIGDLIYYAKPVAQKRADASKLLSLLVAVGAIDPQVSLLLLRECGGFASWCTLLDQPLQPFLVGLCNSLIMMSVAVFQNALR